MLGPTLFLLFINDIDAIFPDTPVRKKNKRKCLRIVGKTQQYFGNTSVVILNDKTLVRVLIYNSSMT